MQNPPQKDVFLTRFPPTEVFTEKSALKGEIRFTFGQNVVDYERRGFSERSPQWEN